MVAAVLVRDWPAAKVEKWPISNLIPAAANARTHSPAQIDEIAAAIRQWGFTTAILVDEQGRIIAGHGRVLAAEKLGLKRVPVMVAKGWTEDQKRAYQIADNKIALNSDWDAETLKAEVTELQGSDFDLSLLGFTPGELDEFLPPVTEEEAAAPLPEAVPPERSSGRRSPAVIQYAIVFDNEAQQDAWFGFVRRLKEKYPDIPTLGARLFAFINKSKIDGA